MKQIKEQLQQILNILKKIDTNITNSTSMSVDKIIDTINTASSNDIMNINNKNIIDLTNKEAGIILETAALTAINVIDKAALTAINVIDKAIIDKATIDKKSSATNVSFDNNMYNKCLIHELRTPLSNILLAINFIENNFIEYDKNNELLNIIDVLYKSLNFAEDILTKFCVIQNGTIALNIFEPFSIKELFRNVEKILQYNIKEKDTRLIYNINENVHDMVYGDLVNIKHCVINLIKNAIKYNNQQNNIIIINVNSVNEDNEFQSIIMSILDNNNSIPKHIKDNLFQPFNSTSGSGLGLYICKKILELHNGSIEHEYNNSGNQFNIFIDLKIQRNLNLEENIIIVNSNINENIKYNIIIVDDSELTIKLMYKIFKKNIKINNVMTAKNGLDAIDKIYNNPNEIDIVFIDNEMPKLNGIQTVKLLRGIHFDKIIIGITGSSFTDLNEFNYCGIDYVFSKPLDKNKIEIIMSFLNKDDLVRQPYKTLQLNNSQLEWV
jgi:signal transduction histidine kinase/CheY-like chemotaxis protein